MGKSKKPLAINKAHLTKEEIAKREFTESLVKGNKDKLKAPSWLKDERAKKEFTRLVDELTTIDIITNLDVNNLDVNNLASYCEAYSNYVKATEELNGQSLTIKKCMPNGSYTTVENPLIKIQKLYAEECRRFAGLIGLTIDSRLKFASVKAEKKENEITDEFGDI